jgi:hypothetical protein
MCRTSSDRYWCRVLGLRSVRASRPGQDVLAEGDAAQGRVGPVVLGDERTLLREPALGEAYAIRVLDSLRSSGAAAIRKHDGQQLL